MTICQHYYFVSILMSPSSTVSSLCMIMTVIEVCICFDTRQLFNIHVCSYCTWSVGRILDPFSLTWPGIPDLSEEFLNDVSKMKLQAFLIDFQDWVFYLVCKCIELFDSYLVLTSSSNSIYWSKGDGSKIKFFFCQNSFGPQCRFIVRTK